jgi:hypothetical protein
MKRRLTSVVSTLVSAVALLTVWAGTALADNQYGGVAGQTTSGGGSSGGSLPFTGADLALYAIVGIAVLASGLVLRRVAAGRRGQ